MVFYRVFVDVFIRFYTVLKGFWLPFWWCLAMFGAFLVWASIVGIRFFPEGFWLQILGALGNLCYESLEHRAKAVSLGAIELLISALQNHRAAGVLSSASFLVLLFFFFFCWFCWFLGGFAFLVVFLGFLAFLKGLFGGLVVIFSRLQQFQGLALGNCCNKSLEGRTQAVSLGALELLVKAFRDSKDDRVQRWASYALAELCLSSDPSEALKHQGEALQLGAFDLIADTLPHHLDTLDTSRFFALGALCQGDQAAAGRRQRAVELGAVEEVEKMTKLWPELKEDVQKVLTFANFGVYIV